MNLKQKKVIAKQGIILQAYIICLTAAVLANNDKIATAIIALSYPIYQMIKFSIWAAKTLKHKEKPEIQENKLSPEKKTISETQKNGLQPEKMIMPEIDPMYGKAIEIVLTKRTASTAVLQRRLQLGYTRAARLMDRMEADGIIGPHKGKQLREILISPS
ncbi:MAG: hypothetical protein KKF00_14460 [Proteobacteria bacterium]|nr:hypothetical protein [Pseudomonadota bacterium]